MLLPKAAGSARGVDTRPGLQIAPKPMLALGCQKSAEEGGVRGVMPEMYR
jgi:hypothetical protein